MTDISPKDFAGLEKAVNDAAARTGALWLSFVTLSAYLAITAGAVTHRDLLLETPIKLPVLSVNLPFVGFFVVAPAFFLISHFYLLWQLIGLRTRIADYNQILHENFKTSGDRRLLRHRLDSFVFAQLLVGAQEEREAGFAPLAKLMASITTIAAPLMVLLFIEFTFLPYHNQLLTWFIRAVVLLDLAVAAGFWSFIDLWPSKQKDQAGADSFFSPFIRIAIPIVLCVFIALLAVVVAVFPSETSYRWFHSPITRYLFEGRVSSETGRANSFFSNRLVLSGFQPDAPIDCDSSKRGLSLWGRDLRAAVFQHATLCHSDFTAADLTDADLMQANLIGAKFKCADPAAKRGCTTLRGANLARADLSKATFEHAFLQGADLSAAKLDDAVLSDSLLIAADLSAARITKTMLEAADLDGASLSAAHYQPAVTDGATFDGTWMEGVSVDKLPDGAAASLPAKVDCGSSSFVQTLKYLMCDASDLDSVPYVSRGLIRNRNLIHIGECICALRPQLSSAATCPGSRGLRKHDIDLLDNQIKSNNIGCTK